MSKSAYRPTSAKAPSYNNDDVSEYLSNVGGDKKQRPQFPSHQKKETPSDNMSNYFAKVKKKPSTSASVAPLKETVIDSTGMNGEKKRSVFSKADKADRIITLERENNKLKEKGNLLSLEVHKMNTKLLRISELMNKRHRSASNEAGAYNARDMEGDLKCEIDNLKDKNYERKENVRKLNAILRSLQIPEVKQGKYADVPAKIAVTSSKASRGLQNMVTELRAQLVENERHVVRLTNEKNAHTKYQPGGHGDVDNVRKQIVAMRAEINEIEIKMQQEQNNKATNQGIFDASIAYSNQLKKKLEEAHREKLTIDNKNQVKRAGFDDQANRQEELELLNKECDDMETKIRSITAEPFLRSQDKNIGARLKDLELKLIEQSKTAQQIERDAEEKEAALKKLQNEYQQKIGAKKLLTSEQEKKRDEYNKAKQTREYGPADAAKGLLGLDVAKYATTMTDLAMGGAFDDNEDLSKPLWAKLPFLDDGLTIERGAQVAGVKEDKMTSEQRLHQQIETVKQENAELSAEMTKAEELLRLQTSIEKENTQFYEQEVKNLNYKARATEAKAQELSRQCDEKQRMIIEAEKKLNLRGGADMGADAMRASRAARDQDEMSEFSAISNESTLATDENILDFKVESANFYIDAFGQLDKCGLTKEQMQKRHLITLVTVDFYNHGTETTAMADGVHAEYQTQFSFKNKVDEFYVQFLNRQFLKMDVYMQLDNKAVHLGRAELPLQQLVQKELTMSAETYKTPFIQDTVRVFPFATTNNERGQAAPLGEINFKMQLRRPVQETLRAFRDRTEAANMANSLALQQKGLRPQKKLITIQIIGCSNLVIPWSTVREVLPFFWYQFYTEDEHTSHNGSTINPRFNDTQSYEVVYDSKAISYLNNESLEVMFFDDSADIPGQNDGGKSQDKVADRDELNEGADIIGVARIPLAALVDGSTIYEEYPIHPITGSGNVGNSKVQVKISVMELESERPKQSIATLTRSLQYNQEWERGIIERIARRLSKLNPDMELMFGIFSGGKRTVTKVDFKYTVLHRLQMKSEISEREMDFFLNENEVLAGPNRTRDDNIDLMDFTSIFKDAILHAKDQARDEVARNVRDEYIVDNNKNSMRNFNRSEVEDLMKDLIIQGRAYQVYDSAVSKSRQMYIQSQQFINTLIEEGLVDKNDAAKIISILSKDGNSLNLNNFANLIDSARVAAKRDSEAYRKFEISFKENAKYCCQRLENADINKDGQIACTTFQSALLIKEMRMQAHELKEVFHIVCNRQLELGYVDFICSISGMFRNYFSANIASKTNLDISQSRDLTASRPDLATSESHILINSVGEGPSATEFLTQAITKMENFIMAQESSLSAIFSVMDTDSDREIRIDEFRNKARMLKIDLNDEESRALFIHIDKDSGGTISYKEFVQSFAPINTKQMIKNMDKIINSSKANPEAIFDLYTSDKSKKSLVRQDFTKLVKYFFAKIADYEIQNLYDHFDKNKSGFISKDEFKKAFAEEVRQKSFTVGIEDVIKPMATKLKKFGINFGAVFDKFDQNKNNLLDAGELGEAMQMSLSTELKDEEIEILRVFFSNKYRKTQINRQQFVSLMETDFENKFDKQQAEKSLRDVKTKLESQQFNAQTLLDKFNRQKSEQINLIDYKRAINYLAVLSLSEIDNLAKFMDTNNNGYISTQEFVSKVRNSINMQSTMNASQRTTKWGNARHTK